MLTRPRGQWSRRLRSISSASLVVLLVRMRALMSARSITRWSGKSLVDVVMKDSDLHVIFARNSVYAYDGTWLFVRNHSQTCAYVAILRNRRGRWAMGFCAADAGPLLCDVARAIIVARVVVQSSGAPARYNTSAGARG